MFLEPEKFRSRSFGDDQSKFREKKMKVRLAALLTFAIGFALPTVAQQTNTPDPQLRQQLEAKIKRYDEAMNKNDAGSVAAFFTEDAVLVTNQGPISGREAIEKHFTDVFQKYRFINHTSKADQYSPHVIGTAGNEMWSSGEWSLTLQEKTGNPIPLKGYWSEVYVREGDAWKVRMRMWNITPVEHNPDIVPTASPSSQ